MVLVAAYLLGSVPFAFIAVRLRSGLDIRRQGSGTVGATNTARVLGWGWGFVVLVGDVAKGLAAVWLGMRVTGNPAIHTAAACAAVVGHCFPVWLSFHGGKGLATTAGSFFFLSPLSLGLAAGVWVLSFVLVRAVAVASCLAAAALPVVFWLVRGPSLAAEVPVVLLAAAVVAKHAPDLRRWVRGEEPKGGGAP